MSETLKEWHALTDAPQIVRASVVAVQETGHQVRVRCLIAEQEMVECEVLSMSPGQAGLLAPGDAVLVWRSGREGELPVVLGRIGGEPPVPVSQIPDELLIEAKHSLTLRVGAGSVTIREDGKILIKGKDLVSHAQRLNRIKGGAVQIN